MSYLRNELMRGRAELLMHSSRSCRFPETTGASCQPREGHTVTSTGPMTDFKPLHVSIYQPGT